jgi:hypothetical protein
VSRRLAPTSQSSPIAIQNSRMALPAAASPVLVLTFVAGEFFYAIWPAPSGNLFPDP